MAKQWQTGRTHLVIPDTQCKPGVPLEHLLWLSDYIVDKQPDVIIHLGDHWDMPSLSVYDNGTKKGEGRNYQQDIRAGNLGMDLIMRHVNEYNAGRRKLKEKQYRPRLVFCLGNHEERIMRHVNAHAILDGSIGYHHFNLLDHGWEVHDFLHVVKVDGIAYTHYFANPNTGKPFGGNMLARLKTIGFSFTMGHQQGKDAAERYLADGSAQRSLVIGSYYQHQESYKGPQGNHHWRGVIMKHEVDSGNYDLMEVSLDYLRRRYYARRPRANRDPIIFGEAGDE